MMRNMRVCAMGFVLVAALALAANAAFAKTNPKLTCVASAIRQSGTSIILTASCKIGTKHAPFTTTWKEQTSDIARAACRIGTTTGTGKTAPLPKAKAFDSSSAGSTPAHVSVTFTVTAHWGKQVAHATRTWKRDSADSKVLCGSPPPITSVDGSTASACTWSPAPKFNGTALTGGGIRCAGNGSCKWLSPSWLQQYGYLTYRYTGQCSNGYRVNVVVFVYYNYDQSTNTGECETAFTGVNDFGVSPEWGPSSLDLYAGVATWNGGTEFPWTSANLVHFRLDALRGHEDPCTTVLKPK